MDIREYPLYSTWGKYSRAGEHMDAFKSHTIKSLRTIPLGHYFNVDSRKHILYLSTDVEQFLSDFKQAGLILGDIIHNLRSALDHLIFSLAKLEKNGNHKNSRSLQFLICDNEEKWFAQMSRINQLSETHRMKIHEFQPFHERNLIKTMSSNSIKPLALLRDFSNIDKHQHICKMSIPPGGMKFNSQFADLFHKIVQEGVLPGYYTENVIIDASHFNTDIYEFGTKLSFPRDRFDNIGDVSIVLTTQDGHIVMEILNILFNTVHAIISEFEKSFPPLA